MKCNFTSLSVVLFQQQYAIAYYTSLVRVLGLKADFKEPGDYYTEMGSGPQSIFFPNISLYLHWYENV